MKTLKKLTIGELQSSGVILTKNRMKNLKGGTCYTFHEGGMELSYDGNCPESPSGGDYYCFCY